MVQNVSKVLLCAAIMRCPQGMTIILRSLFSRYYVPCVSLTDSLHKVLSWDLQINGSRMKDNSTALVHEIFAWVLFSLILFSRTPIFFSVSRKTNFRATAKKFGFTIPNVGILLVFSQRRKKIKICLLRIAQFYFRALLVARITHAKISWTKVFLLQLHQFMDCNALMVIIMKSVCWRNRPLFKLVPVYFLSPIRNVYFPYYGDRKYWGRICPILMFEIFDGN